MYTIHTCDVGMRFLVSPKIGDTRTTKIAHNVETFQISLNIT